MAVYTHLTTDEIAAFFTRYGRGDVRYAKGMAEGVENSNYLLGVVEKGRETKYILTLYEKRVRREDLPYFLSVMEHFAAEGVPCPLPLKDKDGQIIQEIAGRPAAVISFLSGGECRHIIPSHMEQLGETVAHMHAAGGKFKGWRLNALSVQGWRRIYEKTKNRLDEIAPNLEQIVRKELEFLAAHWPSGLPAGVVHADLFPDNVFFSGDKLTGVIDFYFACNDAFAYDLAIVMNAWCFTRPDWKFDTALAKALFTGYLRSRMLSDKERETFPVLARGAALRFLLTRAHDWLHRVEGAVVTPKDPKEYLAKLQFHQGMSFSGSWPVTSGW